jgi:hypothetical protein
VLSLGVVVFVVLIGLDDVPGNEQLDLFTPWGPAVAVPAIALLVTGLVGFVHSDNR